MSTIARPSCCSPAGSIRRRRPPSRGPKDTALFALSVDYGQRHRFELEAAARGCRVAGRRAACDGVGRAGSVWRQRADRRHRRAAGPQRRRDVAGHSRSPMCRPATRCSSRWRWGMLKWWARPTCSSASTRSTTRAIPTAGRSSSPSSSSWPTWRRRRASKARCGSASTRR